MKNVLSTTSTNFICIVLRCCCGGCGSNLIAMYETPLSRIWSGFLALYFKIIQWDEIGLPNFCIFIAHKHGSSFCSSNLIRLIFVCITTSPLTTLNIYNILFWHSFHEKWSCQPIFHLYLSFLKHLELFWKWHCFLYEMHCFSRLIMYFIHRSINLVALHNQLFYQCTQQTKFSTQPSVSQRHSHHPL